MSPLSYRGNCSWSTSVRELTYAYCAGREGPPLCTPPLGANTEPHTFTEATDICDVSPLSSYHNSLNLFSPAVPSPDIPVRLPSTFIFFDPSDLRSLQARVK